MLKKCCSWRNANVFFGSIAYFDARSSVRTAVDDYARLAGRVFRDILQLVEMRGSGRNVSSDKCEWESGPKWFPTPPTSLQFNVVIIRTLHLVGNFGFYKNHDLSHCFRFYYVDPVQTGIPSKGFRLNRAEGRFGFRSTKLQTVFGPPESAEYAPNFTNACSLIIVRPRLSR